MAILISSHIDKVFNGKLEYKNGIHKGLLDNIMGVLVSYITLYSDKTIRDYEKKGKIIYWHNTEEEWGILDNTCPHLHKNDIAIAVDVCSSKKYNNIDFSLENINGFTQNEIKELKDFLQWEGFKIKTSTFRGHPSEEDEAWYFRKKCKTFSFIIPIKCNNNAWHTEDCKVSNETISKCVQGLKRIINYLI